MTKITKGTIIKTEKNGILYITVEHSENISSLYRVQIGRDNCYELHRANYHEHRGGQPVQNKYPRWEFIKSCASRDECIAALKRDAWEEYDSYFEEE